MFHDVSWPLPWNAGSNPNPQKVSLRILVTVAKKKSLRSKTCSSVSRQIPYNFLRKDELDPRSASWHKDSNVCNKMDLPGDPLEVSRSVAVSSLTDSGLRSSEWLHDFDLTVLPWKPFSLFRFWKVGGRTWKNYRDQISWIEWIWNSITKNKFTFANSKKTLAKAVHWIPRGLRGQDPLRQVFA